MNRLVAAYLVIFLIFALVSSFAEGGSGLVATQLDGAINDNDTTIDVDTTEGFLTAGSIIVGSEEIAYTGKNATQFTGGVRGFRRTDAAAHADNRAVYSPATGVINRALGFDIATVQSEEAKMSVVNIAWNFFTQSLGYLVTFNFPVLGGDLVYVRYLLMAPAVGFVLYLAINALGTLFGILTRNV